MKKLFSILLALLCVLTVVFAFTSCGSSDADTFSVKKPSVQTGYTISGADTAVKGENYEFTVTISEGYKKGLGFRVTVNDAPIPETNGKYVVQNVSADLVIAVEDVVADASASEKVTVTLPKDAVGYTVSGEATAVKGSNYEFTVTVSSGYEAGEDFAVKVNGKVIDGADGKYTVSNVTDDLVIEVTGVIKNADGFTVTFPENPVGYTVSGETTVTEGGRYEFTVTISAGYEAGEDFAVKVNGKVVTGTNGKYTVENVTEDLVIEVTGVRKNPGVVTVRLPDDPVGYTVSGDETAVKGSRYEFTVTILPGYQAGEDFAVTANGTVLYGNNSTYVIDSIQSNTIIEVKGVEETTLTAIFVAEGFDDALNNLSEGFSFEAESFTFRIELSAHYTQCVDDIEVYYATEDTAEVKLTPDADGVYTIPNPHKNVTVTVRNISLNQYTVRFFRNAVEKFSVTVDAKSVLTSEQLNAAKAAILNEGEEFVAWREDVTAAISGDTVFSAYTRFDPVIDEPIDGCPLAGGVNVSLGENEYSAAGGFEKVYSLSNTGTGMFADMDITKYSEVRFAFKLDESWILFDGWTYYVDAHGVWLDVVMTNLFTGKWQVTVTGPVNHNGDSFEVVGGFTAEYEGSTLSELLSAWYNDSNAAVISMTELRGIKVLPYGEVISGVPADGFAPSTDKAAPADFASVYYLMGPTGKKFADVDISRYSEVKFYLSLTNQYILINGWGAYAENAGLGNGWVPVTLVNNGNNKWTVTIAGKITGGDVTDPNKYTYTMTGSKLCDVLRSWFDAGSSVEAEVYLTEIRGIKMDVKPIGEEIEGGVLTSGLTLDASGMAPVGFEKVYRVDGTFDDDKKSTLDLSGYVTVTFAFKSNGYFLFDGWSIYLNENYTDWVIVTMTNNGDGTWEVRVDGDVFGDGANHNPWTITYSGSNIQTILANWYNGSNIFLTELRGVAVS